MSDDCICGAPGTTDTACHFACCEHAGVRGTSRPPEACESSPWHNHRPTDISEAEQAACPNCGSALWVDHGDVHDERGGLWQRTWICCSTQIEGFPLSVKPGCELIRSLREELAEVRGLAISMAYELKCSFTDMDCDGECANAGCGSCYPCKLHVQAKALRNNEHRSDT